MAGNVFRTSKCELICVDYDHITFNLTTFKKDVIVPGVLCTYDLGDVCLFINFTTVLLYILILFLEL